jgi:hypothetical protein
MVGVLMMLATTFFLSYRMPFPLIYWRPLDLWLARVSPGLSMLQIHFLQQALCPHKIPSCSGHRPILNLAKELYFTLSCELHYYNTTRQSSERGIVFSYWGGGSYNGLAGMSTTILAANSCGSNCDNDIGRGLNFLGGLVVGKALACVPP